MVQSYKVLFLEEEQKRNIPKLGRITEDGSTKVKSLVAGLYHATSCLWGVRSTIVQHLLPYRVLEELGLVFPFR